MKNTKFFFKTVLCGLAFGIASCTKTVNVPSTKPVLPNGEVELTTFCIDEAYDRPGEYMAGLGISEGHDRRNKAIVGANRVAITDIETRYIGVLKNVIEEYTKDTTIPSGQRIYEDKLEGGVEAIGTKIIEKHANAVCRKITQDATGAFVGYVAVHVDVEDLQKGLQEELDVRKVDYDAEKLMKKHKAALSDSSSKKQKELDTWK